MTASVVDFDRYPIDQPGTERYDTFVAECARTFVDDGLVLLPGFLTAHGVDALVAEAAELVPKAFFCRNEHNVLLDGGDPAVPAGAAHVTACCEPMLARSPTTISIQVRRSSSCTKAST